MRDCSTRKRVESKRRDRDIATTHGRRKRRVSPLAVVVWRAASKHKVAVEVRVRMTVRDVR